MKLRRVPIVLLAATGALLSVWWISTDRPRALQPFPPASTMANDRFDAIRFDRLPSDDGPFAPLARSDIAADLTPEDRARLDLIQFKLSAWDLGNGPDSDQSIRALLDVAAIAGANQDRLAGAIARSILNLLYARYRRAELVHGLAAVALQPDAGGVVTSAPEIGIASKIEDHEVRARSATYAAKFFGRLRGQIPN